MAANFNPFGYTKPSSSSAPLTCESRLKVFASIVCFSSATMGSVASTAASVEGATVCTTPGLSTMEGSWLGVAVLSESAMLALVDGLRWSFVSFMSGCRVGYVLVGICAKARALASGVWMWKAKCCEVKGRCLRDGDTISNHRKGGYARQRAELGLR
jgi:hypothetical protein